MMNAVWVISLYTADKIIIEFYSQTLSIVFFKVGEGYGQTSSEEKKLGVGGWGWRLHDDSIFYR